MKVKRFFDDLYHAEVLFIYNASHEEVNSYAEKRYGSSPECSRSHCGGVWSVEDRDGNEVNILWLAKKNDVSTLAHESIHLAMDIFDRRGVYVDGDHQEHFAYYVQYWIDRLAKEMKRGA